MRRVLSPLGPLALALVASASAAGAHPISQGALDVNVGAGTIVVTARVPVEEVFVAGAFGVGPSASEPTSLSEAWKEHGDYLLRHLRVAADGHALSGSIVGVLAPASAKDKMVTYAVSYRAPRSPRQLTLEQDLLREIDYAPGNPWEATYVVRVSNSDVAVHAGLLLASGRALTLGLETSAGTPVDDRQRIFRDYLRHGVVHILSGYDHVLFIIALALAAVSFWDLAKVIGAFTLAHSLTLTLSVFDLVRMPSGLVEPMIAVSIVIVAASNVAFPRSSRGWARLATAFFFGLFHGLGFAGGLLDAMGGMTGVTVGFAILAFSLGVELGHQMIVLPLFFALKTARSTGRDDAARDRFMLKVQRAGSAVISVAGVAYLIAALIQ